MGCSRCLWQIQREQKKLVATLNTFLSPLSDHFPVFTNIYRKMAMACRILVWEDGFCNFAASSSDCQGLQPELFFKMSHEIYNYGEGQVINFNQLTFLFFSSSSIKSYAPLHHSLIGKVAADRSHKWIYKEPNDQVINLLSSWHNSADTVLKHLSCSLLLISHFRRWFMHFDWYAHWFCSNLELGKHNFRTA